MIVGSRTCMAISAALGLVLFGGIGGASADSIHFVTTGQSGANVTVDINHTQYWTYSVLNDVWGVAGGLFTMKRGSATTSDINFSIFEGTFADFGSAQSLLDVTLTPASFTQQWRPVAFEIDPITLLAGRTYTAVLFTLAADQGSTQYFLKGGSASPLYFVDADGNAIDSPGSIIPPGGQSLIDGGPVTLIPLPAAAPAGLALFAVVVAWRRFGRRGRLGD